MFWIILLFVFFLICVINSDKSSAYDDGSIIGGLSFILLLIVSFFIIESGISSYANMKGEEKEILALQNEIETIRKAHYSEIKSGDFIGGSLDNMGQSTVLTTYLQEYAKKKATHNCNLEILKLRRTMKVYRWFSNGMFIPERINELKEL